MNYGNRLMPPTTKSGGNWSQLNDSGWHRVKAMPLLRFTWWNLVIISFKLNFFIWL